MCSVASDAEMNRGDVVYGCAETDVLRAALADLNEATVLAVAGSNVTLLVYSNGKFGRIEVPRRYVCTSEVGMHIGQPCLYCGFGN